MYGKNNFMMRKAYRSKYGPPELFNIVEIEKPAPAANQLLVKVYATTVNRTDCVNLTGKPFIIRFFIGLFKPKLPTTGSDFAGIIEEVGSEVTHFKVGDKVWGFDDMGLSSHAEYLVIRQNKSILTIPKGFSFAEAAASAEAAHYAYNFINKVKLHARQKILVNGATGGIGSSVIQFLKYYNIEVTAVCSTSSIELIKSLGADKVIDYTQKDFTKEDATYDFVFDAVGKSSFYKCKRILKKGGAYISSELGPYAQNIYLPLVNFIMNKKVIFPVPVDIKRSMTFIQELAEKQQFKPLIDRKYSLDEIKEAYKYVASGQKIGNVILKIG